MICDFLNCNFNLLDFAALIFKKQVIFCDYFLIFQDRGFRWDEGWSHEIFCARRLDGKVVIRLNGGTPENQQDMSFDIPDEYSYLKIRAKNPDSEIYIEKATGKTFSP